MDAVLALSRHWKPLRADPVRLDALCAAYVRDTLPTRSADAQMRWRAVEPALQARTLRPGWRREASGRIHAVHPPVQVIPRAVRPAFLPSGVFVDADWSAAHPTIAAVRSGDEALRRDLQDPGYYARVGDWLTRDVQAVLDEPLDGQVDTRALAKRVVCALVNGGRPLTLVRYLKQVAGGPFRGVQKAARSFFSAWWEQYPQMASWGTSVARAWRPGVSVLTTLTGRSLGVEAPDWRSFLSAHYSSVEAEALDRFLRDSPFCRDVVIPMFDGVLLDVDVPYPTRVEEWMSWAMTASGVAGVGVKVSVQSAWG